MEAGSLIGWLVIPPSPMITIGEGATTLVPSQSVPGLSTLLIRLVLYSDRTDLPIQHFGGRRPRRSAIVAAVS